MVALSIEKHEQDGNSHLARSYVRNGVWGWSIEDQRAALRAAELHDPTREYCDELAASKAKKPGTVQPEWLVQRNDYFLRKTGARRPGEVAAVATLLALGVNQTDLAKAISAALARRDTVQAADSGFSIGPGAGPAQMTAALEDWERAKKDAQTKPGRREGNRVAAEKKRAETLRKLPPARPLWRSTKPDRLTGAQIAEMVGLSEKTLFQELGRRPAVKKGKSK